MTERVNYSIINGQYCGHAVNLPIVIQAESLDDLKNRARLLTESFISTLQETILNDDFEFVEIGKPIE